MKQLYGIFFTLLNSIFYGFLDAFLANEHTYNDQ